MNVFIEARSSMQAGTPRAKVSSDQLVKSQAHSLIDLSRLFLSIVHISSTLDVRYSVLTLSTNGSTSIFLASGSIQHYRFISCLLNPLIPRNRTRCSVKSPYSLDLPTCFSPPNPLGNSPSVVADEDNEVLVVFLGQFSLCLINSGNPSRSTLTNVNFAPTALPSTTSRLDVFYSVVHFHLLKIGHTRRGSWCI